MLAHKLPHLQLLEQVDKSILHDKKKKRKKKGAARKNRKKAFD